MATGNNISEKITDIQTQRNKIRDWLMLIGKASTASKLSDCATAVNEITIYANQNSFQILEGESYTIPAGYHDGTQTITNVDEGLAGEYKLYEYSPITPTKERQDIPIPQGYYGLSALAVEAIPDAYQDVSGVTATADKVLVGEVFVYNNGQVTIGTMTDNGAVTKTLDVDEYTYTIPKGYHNGYGTVSITLEEKTATPTKSQQIITPSAEKVLNKVIINPIPDEYISTTDADAVSENILNGKTAYVNGVKLTGSMKNNGSISANIVGLTNDNSTYTIPAGYHSGYGTVSLSSDIENLLAEI